MKKYYVGIDFGGMSAKAGLFDDKGTMIAKDTVKTSREEGYVTTVTKMAQLTRSLAERCGGMKNVAAVGVGSPGVIDGAAGVVVRWSNYDWRDKPLGPDLCEMLGKPVFVANDANAAALGAAKYGAGQMYQDSILLTLGPGGGSGIIIRCHLFECLHGAGG